MDPSSSAEAPVGDGNEEERFGDVNEEPVGDANAELGSNVGDANEEPVGEAEESEQGSASSSTD